MHSTNNMQLLNNFKNYRILIELKRNAIISIIYFQIIAHICEKTMVFQLSGLLMLY